ncbi:MAG: hypothetical protein ACQET7_10265 [Thermodesulfobacteriota bacterium]
MAGKDNQQEQADLSGQLLELYQDLLQEGILEDMELYNTDPIRMVSEEMADFIRTITGDSATNGPESEQEQSGDTAVFVSRILAAAEALPLTKAESPKSRLDEIKAPLQRSVDLLTKIIEDDKAIRVSKQTLRQNVEILNQCLSRLDRVD